MSELLLALNKTVISECFATQNAIVTRGGQAYVCPLCLEKRYMDNIKIYEIDSDYIDYLAQYAPHLFHNRKKGQSHERKYLGIVLHINEFDYFAPLSSFKPKHKTMKQGLDLIKLKDYAVINLNNMFPVPASECSYVDFSKIQDLPYKSLLLKEYRCIRSIQEKIRKNAAAIYKHKLENGVSTALAKRCNDFALLEKICKEFN